ncbi:MAG: hypothetical protein JTJ14_01145, partial [Lactococcus lactis]|nr:hypothetical protein [Lactococcus lactis]
VISDIINATIELTTKYKNEDNKNSNYLVDLAIYFKVNYPDNFKQKADLIAEDPRIKATFEKSPSTTSMVNKRLEIMTDIILGK